MFVSMTKQSNLTLSLPRRAVRDWYLADWAGFSMISKQRWSSYRKEKKMNMTKILATAVIMSLLTFSAFSVSADGHAPTVKKKETKIVKIEGSRAWTNTGIRLRPQDRVTVKVSGSVCFSNQEPQSCVDADGWKNGQSSYAQSWADNYNYCDDPMRTANHACVIANVGSNDFVIGKHKQFFGKDGVLYLGINDCTFKGKYYYNTGSFRAVITVLRDVIPHNKVKR